MTSPAQMVVNQANATRSTGPRTAKGKAVAARNATKHGLLAEVPVIPGESLGEWEEFRDGIFQSLGASGMLESQLACRIAVVLWKMRRATAFESAMTASEIDKISDARQDQIEWHDHDLIAHMKKEHEQPFAVRMENVERELPDEVAQLENEHETGRQLEQLLAYPDHKQISGSDVWALFSTMQSALPDDTIPDFEGRSFLASVGVPLKEVAVEEAYEWEDWTAGMIRRGAELLAKAVGWSVADLVERARQTSRSEENVRAFKVKQLKRKAAEYRRRVKVEEERLRIARMMPKENILQLVTRYESHLTRQLSQFLQLLERIQKNRPGAGPPALSILEVTVEREGNHEAASASGE